MQLTTTTSTLPSFPENSTTWDAVRYWIAMSERFARASLASQVMAGFSLLELHASLKMRSGRRTDLLNLPNDLVGSIPSQQSPQSHSWPALVKSHTGLSDETARNYMKMATGVKKRWADLPIRDRLHTLMSVPASQWQEEDAKLITEAVHKATDGLTQMDFMWSLGLAKKPGSGPRGHNKPTQTSQPGQSGPSVDPAADDDDDDELLTEFRNDMRVFTGADDDTLIRCSTETLTKHLAEVEAYTIRIREILSRRKTIAQRGVKPAAARAASAPKRIDL